MKIGGNIVDIYNRRIFPGEVTVEEGRIVSVVENTNEYTCFIAPGFIDAHVHVESSMLVPVEFSKLAVRRGTVAIVNDPHEIANVLGVEGIRFMRENSKQAGIRMFFTVPSCVPATPFDCSGSSVSAADVEQLLSEGGFVGLSEVMNVPGVLHGEAEIMEKISSARSRGLVVDGHAPGLRGEGLQAYVRAGITTDHECTSLEEALEKIAAGMKILIREGSAAKNYEALKPLIASHPRQVMFCTDDSHPGDLLEWGHIDKLVRHAVREGFDLFDVLRVASLNPVEHYRLPVGTLRPGDAADFVVFGDLSDFPVAAVYVGGEERYNAGQGILFPASRLSFSAGELNKFARRPLAVEEIKKQVAKELPCIRVFDGEIVTGKELLPLPEEPVFLESDTSRDMLKIVYLNRYENRPPQVAYIRGIGLKRGAFATSISHDSHNIIAVGCTDAEITAAINRVIAWKGGLAVTDGEETVGMPLPLAGIMTDAGGADVDAAWNLLMCRLARMGCTLSSPFMTLSFMALIVIPELKIGEEGLFEYGTFRFIS